jgi:Kef-type K+ transport system membrane component KefB
MSHDLLTGVSASIIAAAVLALLARRTGQPLILGYIAAGALLGPHLGFGLVADEEAIESISEIGLMFLLFIIGLEINVPTLMRTGRVVITAGLLQFPLCAGLAWLAVGGVTAGMGGSFDRLYLAVALALSSTLIVVKLLFDKLEMATFAGRVTLGILIFQDLWAIGFLAMQPNLGAMAPGRLLASLAAGVALVAAAALLSRYVLWSLFRAIAASFELVLLVAIAWCFLLASAAGAGGLSREMGALLAGMAIAAFPYGTEVISRLAGVRDFFVTLFFVALGLKIPAPSLALLGLALGATVLVIATRFLVIYPLFGALRLDTRSAGVVAVNLSQISEFSLVIVSLGLGYGHVSDDLASLVVYTLIVTSVVSTYGILLNDRIASAITRLVQRTGLPAWLGRTPADEAAAHAGHGEHDLFFLGVSREGLAFIQHLERESPDMKARIVAIDFNPETLERLQADGVACHYGDISNVETLRHAGIADARVVISLISDWFLKGIDNLRILRQVRSIAPTARVVVTADTLAGAQRLYAEGADYVLIPPALSAEHLYHLLLDHSPDSLAEARRRQARELFGAVAGETAPAS